MPTPRLVHGRVGRALLVALLAAALGPLLLAPRCGGTSAKHDPADNACFPDYIESPVCWLRSCERWTCRYEDGTVIGRKPGYRSVPRHAALEECWCTAIPHCGSVVPNLGVLPETCP